MAFWGGEDLMQSLAQQMGYCHRGEWILVEAEDRLSLPVHCSPWAGCALTHHYLSAAFRQRGF